MGETYSEKIVKDTLKRLQSDGELITRQKVSTPRYQKEPIDFHVITLDTVTHLIEVKEKAGTSISPSQFKDHQAQVLGHKDLNKSSSKTKPWIVANLKREDVNRSHSNYFEYFFMVPGYYCDISDPISINELRGKEDVHFLGGFEHGSRVDFPDDWGVTTKGNDTEGLPLIKEVIT